MSDVMYLYRQCGHCGGSGTVGGGQNPDYNCPHCDGDTETFVGEVRWADDAGKKLIQTYEIVENTVPAEYQALSDANKQNYRDIIGMGVIDMTDGTLIRATLWVLFDAQSTTRANILTLLGE